jgi:hypothetical protein
MKKTVARLAAAGMAAVAAFLAIRSLWPTRRVLKEVRKRTHMLEYVEHGHDPIGHAHEHPHVTHNRREGLDELVGEWEHLTGLHVHEHNHAPITHSHLPHENAEHEHLGEAHIHDHSHPSVS